MTEWEYHPAADIDSTLAETLRSFPREPRMGTYFLRSIIAMLLRGWMKVYHRLDIIGREHLPKTGSYVLVCNHTSHLDTLCLLCAGPLRKIHRTFPAAAADYFFSSLPRSAVSAMLINAMPFDRKMKGAESLTMCGELLKNDGNVLIIFPEGTRTTNGEMGRFRSGIGRLVVGTNIRVIPCHLSGGHRAWSKGRLFPRPRKLALRIGAGKSYEQLENTSASIKHVCKDLHDVVAELSSSS